MSNSERMEQVKALQNNPTFTKWVTILLVAFILFTLIGGGSPTNGVRNFAMGMTGQSASGRTADLELELEAKNLLLKKQQDQLQAKDSQIALLEKALMTTDSLLFVEKRKSFVFAYGELETDLPTGYSIEYQELGGGKRAARIIAPAEGNLKVDRRDFDCCE